MKRLKKILLTLYFYLWIFSFRVSRFFWAILLPVNYYISNKLLNKKQKDFLVWKKNYFKAHFDFPGGIIDWFTFGLFIGIFYFGLLLLLIYFHISIKKELFFLIGIIISAYVWLLTAKNKNWLKNKIINFLSKKGYDDYINIKD